MYVVGDDGHNDRYKDSCWASPGLIELAGRLPDHDAETDAPQQDHQLHCRGELWPIIDIDIHWHISHNQEKRPKSNIEK